MANPYISLIVRQVIANCIKYTDCGTDYAQLISECRLMNFIAIKIIENIIRVYLFIPSFVKFAGECRTTIGDCRCDTRHCAVVHLNVYVIIRLSRV